LFQPVPPDSLFARLRAAAGRTWSAYVEHPFVAQLGAGTLPEAAFRRYLVQDYRFLIHFGRAYALAVYKSDTLADMRAAAAGMRAILDDEMDLHVEFCRGWGLTPADLEAAPEDGPTLAYTRYVLETGLRGDVLDLHTALAPCIVGYAEIGAALAEEGTAMHAGHPYRAWVGMYAGDDYQAVARDHVTLLDRLWHTRAGDGRFEALSRIFGEATRLEADFWQMGLDAA